MPKEKNEAQEVENVENTESSEQESTQEAQAEQEAEKGFFAKAVDKAKEATSELFGVESSQEQKEAKPAQTPKLKNAISKKTKLIDSLAYQYNGEEDFTLRVGSKVYVIAQGEILIVPNGNTSKWLAHKPTLFTPVI